MEVCPHCQWPFQSQQQLRLHIDIKHPSVYVDALADYPGKGQWCHMAVAPDTDPEVLHQFAERIGLKREWFQEHSLHGHYDLRPSKRALAVKYGAVELSGREFVERCSKYFR
jgi:hypothetical protein